MALQSVALSNTMPIDVFSRQDATCVDTQQEEGDTASYTDALHRHLREHRTCYQHPGGPVV